MVIFYLLLFILSVVHSKTYHLNASNNSYIQQVFEKELEPGDVVYFDAGYYDALTIFSHRACNVSIRGSSSAPTTFAPNLNCYLFLYAKGNNSNNTSTCDLTIESIEFQYYASSSNRSALVIESGERVALRNVTLLHSSSSAPQPPPPPPSLNYHPLIDIAVEEEVELNHLSIIGPEKVPMMTNLCIFSVASRRVVVSNAFVQRQWAPMMLFPHVQWIQFTNVTFDSLISTAAVGIDDFIYSNDNQGVQRLQLTNVSVVGDFFGSTASSNGRLFAFSLHESLLVSNCIVDVGNLDLMGSFLISTLYNQSTATIDSSSFRAKVATLDTSNALLTLNFRLDSHQLYNQSLLISNSSFHECSDALDVSVAAGNGGSSIDVTNPYTPAIGYFHSNIRDCKFNRSFSQFQFSTTQVDNSSKTEFNNVEFVDSPLLVVATGTFPYISALPRLNYTIGIYLSNVSMLGAESMLSLDGNGLQCVLNNVALDALTVTGGASYSAINSVFKNTLDVDNAFYWQAYSHEWINQASNCTMDEIFRVMWQLDESTTRFECIEGHNVSVDFQTAAALTYSAFSVCRVRFKLGCTPCRSNEFSAQHGRMQSINGDEDFRCQACVDGAYCQYGRVHALPGFWLNYELVAPRSDLIHATLCARGVCGENTDEDAMDRCAPNRHGILCSQCIENSTLALISEPGGLACVRHDDECHTTAPFYIICSVSLLALTAYFFRLMLLKEKQIAGAMRVIVFTVNCWSGMSLAGLVVDSHNLDYHSFSVEMLHAVANFFSRVFAVDLIHSAAFSSFFLACFRLPEPIGSNNLSAELIRGLFGPIGALLAFTLALLANLIRATFVKSSRVWRAHHHHEQQRSDNNLLLFGGYEEEKRLLNVAFPIINSDQNSSLDGYEGGGGDDGDGDDADYDGVVPRRFLARDNVLNRTFSYGFYVALISLLEILYSRLCALSFSFLRCMPIRTPELEWRLVIDAHHTHCLAPFQYIPLFFSLLLFLFPLLLVVLLPRYYQSSVLARCARDIFWLPLRSAAPAYFLVVLFYQRFFIILIALFCPGGQFLRSLFLLLLIIASLALHLYVKPFRSSSVLHLMSLSYGLLSMRAIFNTAPVIVVHDEVQRFLVGLLQPICFCLWALIGLVVLLKRKRA